MANATMTLIASQVLASTSSSVTFSSIPQTYTDLCFKISARDSGGGYAGSMSITFNGDSSTNYSVTRLYEIAGSVNITSTTNATSIVASAYPGNTATASSFGVDDFYIPNYTSTGSRQILDFSASENSSTTLNLLNFGAGLYRGTSAITSVTFNAAANFAQYSSFYLYGIKNS